MHVVVPSGCASLCVCFVGCCVSSYPLVGWMSRSGLMGVVKNVSLRYFHPSIVNGFSEDVRLSFLAGWDRCL